MKKTEENLCELWDTIKQNKTTQNKRREREKDRNILKEIIAEKFLNLGRDAAIQVHKTQRSINRYNPKRYSPRYIIINLSRIKDKEKF